MASTAMRPSTLLTLTLSLRYSQPRAKSASSAAQSPRASLILPRPRRTSARASREARSMAAQRRESIFSLAQHHSRSFARLPEAMHPSSAAASCAAFFYNTIGIPIAAGCLVWANITLNPMIGAAAMSLSSFCVVTNALRLNLFKMYDASKDKPRKHKAAPAAPAEDDTMTVTMHIDGMMCGHCENTVKTALEAVEGVEEVRADAKAGTAVIVMEPGADEQAMRDAVTKAGYVFVGFGDKRPDACPIGGAAERAMKVDGMMCGHCENAVKTALEEVDGILSARANAKDGSVVITAEPKGKDEEIKAAIAKAGYVFLSFVGEEPAASCEAGTVTKTMKIEGMMCEHCERAVNTAVEAVEGVTGCKADAKAGTAVITMKPGTDEEALSKAVTGAGYVVLGLE